MPQVGRAERERAVRAPLPPHVRSAARSAGGWGLTLFSTGVNLVVALSVVGTVVALARWFLVELVAGSDGVEEAVASWLAGIDPTPWIVTIVVVLLVAAGLMALGATASIRILRRAGIARAREITWWCCGVGTVVQAALSIASGWIMTLVGLLTGVVGLGIVVLIYVVASTALTSLVGYLAGPRLWMARTRRELARAAAA